MKIAVFSDIHGNYQALESILNDIKNKDVDKIISLGDLIGLGPCSNDCLKLVNKSNITLILGNHELYYKNIFKSKIEDIDHDNWVHSTISENVDGLDKYELNINDKRIIFIHYFYKDKNSYESFHLFDESNYKDIINKLDYDYIIYGHLHKSRHDIVNNKNYYCLDSSGCTKDDNTFYYLISIDDEVKIEKINLKYDRDTFIKILKNTKYPDREEIALKFYGINLKDVN